MEKSVCSSLSNMSANSTFVQSSAFTVSTSGTSTPSAPAITGSLTLETFCNYPKLVRATYRGTFAVTATGAGTVILGLTCLNSALPSWAIPSTGGVTLSGTTLNASPAGMGALNVGTVGGSIQLQQIYNSGTPASSFTGLFTIVGTMTSTPFSFEIVYLAQ